MRVKLRADAVNSCLRIAEVFGTSQADEAPAAAFELSLTDHVVLDGVRIGVPALAIAFERYAAVLADHHNVDAVLADRELLLQAVAALKERFGDRRFEVERIWVSVQFCLFFGALHIERTLGICAEVVAQVTGLRLQLPVEGVDDPYLIAGAADRNIEALFLEIILSAFQTDEAVLLRNVHEREENDVSFIALEVGGCADDDLVLEKLFGADGFLELVRDGRYLSAASAGAHDDDAEGLFLVLRKFKARLHQAGNGVAFRFIGVAVLPAGNLMENERRQKLRGVCRTQRS